MRKRLGQHFLRSVSVCTTAVAALPDTTTTVVEIGPGKGALTTHLLEKGLRVVAIEKDEVLVEFLQEKFATHITSNQLELVTADARDFQSLACIPDTPYAVLANIPYYITGVLIRTILTHTNPPADMVLVIQKEVAERIARKHKNKESLLSLSVQLFGTPRYIQPIKRTSFSPPPDVDSALLSITDIHTVPVELQDSFFSIAATAFAEKRKVVLKKFRSDATLTAILRTNGITETTRAEDVPFNIWLTIAEQQSQQDATT